MLLESFDMFARAIFALAIGLGGAVAGCQGGAVGCASDWIPDCVESKLSRYYL